jgi:hypothetical protein
MLKHSRLSLGPLSNTPIIIDDFSRTILSTSTTTTTNPHYHHRPTYFLTHAHTDHITGLSNTWNKGRIICTEITRLLILNTFPDLNESLFKIIRIEEPISLWLDDYDHSLGTVTVTAFDANHVSGAVMYLLQGSFGTVLHTGDFRYEQSTNQAKYILSKLPPMTKIDTIYLDNTYGLYQSPKCPPREFILNTLCDTLVSLRSSVKISIGMDMLGKEELLIQLALRLHTTILVTARRLRIIKIVCPIEFHHLFISEEELYFMHQHIEKQQQQPQIRVISRTELACEEADVHIVLSGWENSATTTTSAVITNVYNSNYSIDCFRKIFNVVENNRKSSTTTSASNKTVVVPYSSHSTLLELEQFVTTINPSIIIPTVHETLCGKLLQYRNEDLYSSLASSSLHLYPSVVITTDHHQHQHHPNPTRIFPNHQKRPYSNSATSSERAKVLDDTIHTLDHLLKRRDRFKGKKSIHLKQSNEEVVITTKTSSSSVQNSWTSTEDSILIQMRLAFQNGNEERHAMLRKRLCGWTDVQIRSRLSNILEQQQNNNM